MGYKVSADYRDEVKAVLAFDPMSLSCAMIRLDCCDLLSEINGSEHTRNIRVVMLSPGGSAERTRGLDLGADENDSRAGSRSYFECLGSAAGLWLSIGT